MNIDFFMLVCCFMVGLNQVATTFFPGAVSFGPSCETSSQMDKPSESDFARAISEYPPLTTGNGSLAISYHSLAVRHVVDSYDSPFLARGVASVGGHGLLHKSNHFLMSITKEN